jgi:hypothetical protein|tara:strand:+ start:690 stop:1433 length:744 start_codon:yes stop_codon:yes gene_type:complete
MISRLLALLLLPVVAYYLVKSVSQRFSLTPRQNRVLFFIVAALLVVGVLVVLGRLPVQFIFAPLGAAAAFVLRMLPSILRFLPMWQLIKSRAASAKPRETGQSSTIRTEFFAMELMHDSGDMDGVVLKGAFANQRLSALELNDLLKLYSEAAEDNDSSQVLEAYIDRNHPDWRGQADNYEQRIHSNGETAMSADLALEILGLDHSASNDEVVKAHRNLMQKMHPDRGGSDYLAKKVNAAKDFLVNNL